MDLQERVRLKKADRNELYTLEPPFPATTPACSAPTRR